MEILDILMHLDSNIASFIATHGKLIYLLLFAIVFLEIGVFPLFFLPGNPLIFIAGSFCKIGSLSLLPTLGVLTSAAILGNIFAYQVGKLFGDRINRSQAPWVNKNALLKTKQFYEKYGQWTLMVSPFIAVLRTFAPLLAGVSHMQYKRYLTASSIGTVLWVGLLVSAGQIFSSFSYIQEHMATIVLGGLAIGLAFVVYGLVKRKQQ